MLIRRYLPPLLLRGRISGITGECVVIDLPDQNGSVVVDRKRILGNVRVGERVALVRAPVPSKGRSGRKAVAWSRVKI